MKRSVHWIHYIVLSSLSLTIKRKMKKVIVSLSHCFLRKENEKLMSSLQRPINPFIAITYVWLKSNQLKATHSPWGGIIIFFSHFGESISQEIEEKHCERGTNVVCILFVDSARNDRQKIDDTLFANEYSRGSHWSFYVLRKWIELTCNYHFLALHVMLQRTQTLIIKLAHN